MALQMISVFDVVVGDVFIFRTGEILPCDGKTCALIPPGVSLYNTALWPSPHCDALLSLQGYSSKALVSVSMKVP